LILLLGVELLFLTGVVDFVLVVFLTDSDFFIFLNAINYYYLTVLEKLKKDDFIPLKLVKLKLILDLVFLSNLSQ